MINGMFWCFMNIIGKLFECIIVFGIVGFILLLPFLLKGGWLLGILIYGFLIACIVAFFAEVDNISKEIKEQKEKKGN